MSNPLADYLKRGALNENAFNPNAFDQGMGQQMLGQQTDYQRLGQQMAMDQMRNAAVQPQATPKKEKKSMFKEITTDIKAFVLEHRGVIYFLVFALIVDQTVFKGAFKARLQSMADKLVTKVEEKIQ